MHCNNSNLAGRETDLVVLSVRKGYTVSIQKGDISRIVGSGPSEMVVWVGFSVCCLRLTSVQGISCPVSVPGKL